MTNYECFQQSVESTKIPVYAFINNKLHVVWVVVACSVSTACYIAEVYEISSAVCSSCKCTRL